MEHMPLTKCAAALEALLIHGWRVIGDSALKHGVACMVLAVTAAAWLPSCQGNGNQAQEPEIEQGAAVVMPASMQTVREQREFGPIVVSILESEEPFKSAFTIERAGQLVYAQEIEGALAFPETGTPLQDFNRDGTPDLVLGYFTGGAHCCFRYKLLSLENPVKELFEIASEHSELQLDDGDGDGIEEFYLDDWTFAYWGAPFADSVAEPIVLEIKNGALSLADELMRRPALSRAEWEDRVKDVRAQWADHQRIQTLSTFQDGEWGPAPVLVWATMLDLIYTGNGNDAWRFLDEVWPPDNHKKAAFRKAFEGQLGKSPYYAGLRRLNNW